MKPFRRVLFLALLSLLSLDAAAALQQRQGWVKAFVVAGASAVTESGAKQAAEGAGGELIWLYAGPPRQALVYVPDFGALVSRAKAAGLKAETAVLDERVFVSWSAFDPKTDVPASDDFHSYAAGQEGLYDLQFAGTIDERWATELDRRGVRVVTWFQPNSALVVATPEALETAVAYPWVQWWDFHQPRRKGYDVGDRMVYQTIWFHVPPSVHNADLVRAQLEALATAGTAERGCYTAAATEAVRRHPLVAWMHGVPPPIDVSSVFPDAAPAGAIVRLQTSGTAERVLVGSTPARIVARDPLWTDIEIPSGLPTGRTDIHLFHASGWRQVLPSDGTRGLRITTAAVGETTFQRGDLIVATVGFSVIPGIPTQYLSQWITPAGEVRGREDVPSGMFFFGTQGFLNAPADGRTYRFDAHFEPVDDASHLIDDANDVVLARDSSFIVARSTGVTHYSADGRTVTPLPIGFATDVDLAADQCTLAYAGDEVALYDICAEKPLRTLMTSTAELMDVRFLPDGTLLVAATNEIVRFRPEDGTVVARVPAGSAAIALAPGGSFAWIAFWNTLSRYDLLTNTLVAEDPLVLRTPEIEHIAVYGEWFAARGEARYDDDIVIERIEKGTTGVLLRGHGWMRGATVTYGGLAVERFDMTDTILSFLIPHGTMTTNEVVVTNPNGQRGVRSLDPPRRRAVR